MELSPEELAEWMAFDRLHPFGAKRDDYREALSLSTLVNLLRSDKGTTTLKDVLDKYEFGTPPEEVEDQQEPSEEQVAAYCDAMVAAFAAYGRR